MYPRLPFLLLPYTRRELPGWGKLLKLTCALNTNDDARWKGAPTKLLRGKHHGYVMRLNLSDWSQRMTYFTGRYYELGVQLVLDFTLVRGDRFIDIGANIGMISLHASALVGPTGRVDSFEPNPECVDAIKYILRINEIENTNVHAYALSDHPGEMRLNLTSDHSGTATLADSADVTRSIPVTVKVGDEMLLEGPTIKAIKIDVEGFELHVIFGIRKVLESSTPILITELIEHQLAKAGTSVVEVSSFLNSLGYIPHGIGSFRQGLKHKLVLYRTLGKCNDAVWIHRDKMESTGLMKYVE